MAEPLTRIGQYELRGVLGQGGMATVYRAYQPSLDREVAVKVIAKQFASDVDFRERFRREARAVARLRHPNILAVYDFGEDDGAAYLVTELVKGGTLHARTGRVLQPREVARLVRQLGEALDHAHGAGLIHRDVKPGNIFIEGQRAILADFGIVKAANEASDLTKTGVGLGTPEYIAPEQALGEVIDGRADLYSLGVVAYELLTGAPPYKDDTPVNILYAHIRGDLPAPSTRNPALAGPLEATLRRALARQPAARFATGAAFADAMERAVAAGARGSTDDTSRGAATISTIPPQRIERTIGGASDVQGAARLPTPLAPRHDPIEPRIPSRNAATILSSSPPPAVYRPPVAPGPPPPPPASWPVVAPMPTPPPPPSPDLLSKPLLVGFLVGFGLLIVVLVLWFIGVAATAAALIRA